jgi:hypothetical protein
VAVTTNPSLLALDADTYQRHPLHDDDRAWPETNCYVDLWIELLHALEFDAVAPLAFLLSSDFDGEQWEFFKYPPEDLRSLYGFEVREFNVWRSLEQQIEEHLRLGHLMTIEADSWFLPDTAGVSYQLGHQKSTIGPAMIDTVTRRMGYFHNRGYYVVSGADYEGVLRTDALPSVLPPYAEVISLDRLQRPDPVTLRSRVDVLISQHLERRPTSNPVQRMAARICADTAWLQAASDDTFHGYAFGTLRQCGAWADTLSTFVGWLGREDLTTSAAAFAALSSTAKTCQFKLARLATGRATDLSGLFASMSQSWDDGFAPLVAAYG